MERSPIHRAKTKMEMKTIKVELCPSEETHFRVYRQQCYCGLLCGVEARRILGVKLDKEYALTFQQVRFTRAVNRIRLEFRKHRFLTLFETIGVGGLISSTLSLSLRRWFAAPIGKRRVIYGKLTLKEL